MSGTNIVNAFPTRQNILVFVIWGLYRLEMHVQIHFTKEVITINELIHAEVQGLCKMLYALSGTNFYMNYVLR